LVEQWSQDFEFLAFKLRKPMDFEKEIKKNAIKKISKLNDEKEKKYPQFSTSFR